MVSVSMLFISLKDAHLLLFTHKQQDFILLFIASNNSLLMWDFNWERFGLAELVN